MDISATVISQFHKLDTSVETNGISQTIEIPMKSNGSGSEISGGELLLLALATCFCNDLYREADKRSIPVSLVEVTVTGRFAAEGEPGTDFSYRARVEADASPKDIEALVRFTDSVAEIQNTLRKGLNIALIV